MLLILKHGQHHARDGLAARVGERQGKLILHDNYLFLTIVVFVHCYFCPLNIFDHYLFLSIIYIFDHYLFLSIIYIFDHCYC